MDPPTYYVRKKADLRYFFAFPARIFVSGIEKVSEAKDVGLLLKAGMDSHGWVPLNLHQINDAREIDYCLLALEQALEALLAADAVDGEALSVAEEAVNYFTTRLSVPRSVCDDEGVRAVVSAVLDAVRAARSQRVEGDDTRADVGGVVTMLQGVAHSLVSSVLGVVRAAPSPRVQVEDAVVSLARAALGEVRSARARPVMLYNDSVPLQISSVQEAQELLRAAPPHTRGVWNTTRMLDVRSIAHLRDVGNLHYELGRCSQLGWRIPKMTEVGKAKRLDCHLILLNHKLKFAFNRTVVHEDGTIDPEVTESVGKHAEALVKVCTEELRIFQSEIATIPDIITRLLTIADACKSPEAAAGVRRVANEAIVVIHNIRNQQVRF